jgi:hypothetical protein
LKRSKGQHQWNLSRHFLLAGSCLILSIFLSSGLPAQMTGPSEGGEQTAVNEPETALMDEPIPEPALTLEDLPGEVELAIALADPPMRTDTLLTMIAVARLLEYGTSVSLADPQVVSERFRDERAWLGRLARHFLELPSRGSQLDPAAWFVLLELNQYGVTPGLFVSPLGPEDRSLMKQLFDRSNERLSAAVLPEAIQRIELQSTALWSSLLAAVMINDLLLTAILDLHPDWFADWVGLAVPASAVALTPEPNTDDQSATEPVSGTEMMDQVINEALTGLQVLADSTIQSGPGDARVLQQLRIDLLSAMPRLADPRLKDAEYILVLAAAIDGLNDGKYLGFTESLLWVVSDLLLTETIDTPVLPETPVVSLADPEQEELPDTLAGEVEIDDPVQFAVQAVPEPYSRLPRFLSELLPRLSNTYSGEFSAVDPRINATLAAVFDAMQYLQGDRTDIQRLSSLRWHIGDAIAQMVLMVPEMNYYFDQPVRRRITEEINVCTGLAANTDTTGVPSLTREQFDGCLTRLVEISENLVNKEELAGDPDGPFGSDQLRRELMMPPWQRINFSLGYMHERFTTACEMPAEPIPNPLEWSGLATLIAWFARQAPVYFQTPESEALVSRMRQQGIDLLENMTQQVDCISGEGAGINDPVVRSLVDYRLALQDVVAGIRETELEFREAKLKPGADIVLHGDASQKTAYRSEDMSIGPCDPAAYCEMTGELEATRALIGQFPDPNLIADQTGLGRVEICYENVRWVERRAEPVRPEDPQVANYFGKLSFDLIGRYQEKGETRRVFGANFVSPDEYHYLFAAATDDVHEDSCPTEWVGTKIVTRLGNKNPIRVVPDRLTYMASARKKPSEIINANWSKGSQWRDWFVTGLGVTPYEFEPDEGLSDRVDQHLQGIYQAEQSVLYSELLRPQSRGGRFDDETLLELQEELTARKALVRSYINLFYPGHLIDSDEIRAALEGYDALLDTRVLRRFRESNIAVASINELGLSRLEEFESNWRRQLDTVRRSGSISTSVAHALMRLNALYLDFFVHPAEPLDSLEATTPAGG